MWRVGREKAILGGGPTALLLQVAHPLVAAGVVDHSDFESDPLGRLRRTLDTMLTVGFGDRAQAEAAVAGVAAVHVHVRGPSYRADDPDLALWVHATLVLTALGAYESFVGPLSDDDKADYYERYKVVGRMFGVTDEVMPPTYADFVAYVRHMVDRGARRRRRRPGRRRRDLRGRGGRADVADPPGHGAGRGRPPAGVGAAGLRHPLGTWAAGDLRRRAAAGPARAPPPAGTGPVLAALPGGPEPHRGRLIPAT